jgi:long-chain acyl-CoA synthetase
MTKPALIVGDKERSHEELAERSARLADELSGLGVSAGDRVAVMLPNGFEFFEVQAACGRLGAALVPVNWHLKEREVRWILEDSQARAVVVADDLAASVEPPDGCAVLQLPRSGSSPADVSRGRGTRTGGGGTTATLVLYTSGTSGRPKGVDHVVRAGGGGRSGLADLWGFTADDVHLLAAPAYHGAPWSHATTHLAIGATVVVLPRWSPKAWLAAVARHRVTTTFMVPAQMAHVVNVYDGEDLSSLRLVLHGGAACPVAVKRAFLDLVPAGVWEFYGFSEGGRATRISAEEWRERPGSVGRPFPGVVVRILDDDGGDVPAGEDGLVYVEPPGGATFSYLGNPEATAAASRGSACTGGDIGHLDRDGYLWITDRAVDMVIRGGVNIYPREIEDVLHEHPGVVDCAVFGVPDPVLGERLVALVESTGPVTPENLQSFVRGRLADFKVPERIELTDALPRDPNGKVRKRLLAAEWDEVPRSG